MIVKISSVILIPKKYGVTALKLTLVLMMMFNFSCTYKQVHAKGTIEVHFSQLNDSSFSSAFKEFSESANLTFNDGTREYPSGAKAVLLELTTEDGGKILKVNDYMDGTRFVVSAYENNKRDWKPLFDSCFNFLQERFPDAKFEKKLADSEKSTEDSN